MKKVLKYTLGFVAFILLSTQMVFAATFTTEFTTATNYTNDSEVEITGGLAKLKESNIFSKASAYWKLNESSGTLVDSTGNGNDGTAINSPTYGATGRGVDTVLEFNGVSQRVDIPNSSDVSMGHGTWEAWIYPTSFGDHAYHAIISKKYNTAYWFGLYQNTGRIQLWVGGTPKYTSTSNVVSLNTWSHVVVTWDGSNIKFYINGSLVETIANASAIKTNTQNAGIGTDVGDSNLYEFTGRIGEVALYNGEVLSDAEVLWLYNNGLKKYYNGTVYKTSGNTDSNLSSFTSFNVTEGTVEGELRYQLSTDGSSWQYWNGSNWVLAGNNNYNSELDINNHISTFPSGPKQIYTKSFLRGDGSERVEIDKIEIDYAPVSPTTAPDLISASDSGSLSTDNVTSDNTPTFDIQCSFSGNTINLYRGTVGNYINIGTHVCIGVGTEQIIATTLGDGAYQITYTNQDSGGESQHSPVLSVVIDTTNPILNISAVDTLTNGVNDPIINFSATDNNAVDYYTVEYTKDNNGAGLDGVTTIDNPVNSPLTLDLDPDENVHTVIIVTYDKAGNYSSNTIKFPPIIIFNSPLLSNGTFSSSVIISSPAGNDLNNIQITNQGGTNATLGTCTGAGNDMTSPYASPVVCDINNISANGTVVITADDATLGATGENSQSYTIDTINPVIAITAPTKIKNASIIDTTIIVADNNGINVSDVTVDVSTTVQYSNFNCTQTNSTQVDCTISIDGPLNGGGNNLVIKAEDNAGNNTTKTESGYIIDTIAPGTPICSTVPASAGNGSSVTTTCTGVEAGVAVTILNMTCAPTPADATGIVVCTGNVGTGAGEIATSNDIVTVTDGAGNTNTSATTGLIVDNTPPADPSCSTTPTPAGNGDGVTTTCTGVENGTILTIPHMTCLPTPTDATGTVVCTGTAGVNGLDGVNTIVTVEDLAGNINNNTTSGLVIDTDNDGTPDINDDDDDGDGVNDIEENLAPNGDGNGDGSYDSLQKSVATVKNDLTEAYTTLQTTGCQNITNFKIEAEEDLSVQDNDYSYPLGLGDFTLGCTNTGDTATITVFYDDQYDTSKWSYRKYNPNTKEYFDISNLVTYGTAIINSKIVTTVTYQIQDGDNTLDNDKTANAAILDPAGPAIAESLNKGDGSIGNYIWLDKDGDGKQDKDEEGLENIRVKLIWYGANGKYDHGKKDDKVWRTDTNHNGHYKFENLPKGKHKVIVKEEDVARYVQTYDPDNTMDSIDKITLRKNQNYTKADFGYNDVEMTLAKTGENWWEATWRMLKAGIF